MHHHQLQHHHHLPDASHYNRNQALINSSAPILPNPMSALTQLNLQVSRGVLPHGSPSPPGSKSATPSPSSSNQEEEAEAHLKVLMRLEEFCFFFFYLFVCLFLLIWLYGWMNNMNDDDASGRPLDLRLQAILSGVGLELVMDSVCRKTHRGHTRKGFSPSEDLLRFPVGRTRVSVRRKTPAARGVQDSPHIQTLARRTTRTAFPTYSKRNPPSPPRPAPPPYACALRFCCVCE